MLKRIKANKKADRGDFENLEALSAAKKLVRIGISVAAGVYLHNIDRGMGGQCSHLC